MVTLIQILFQLQSILSNTGCLIFNNLRDIQRTILYRWWICFCRAIFKRRYELLIICNLHIRWGINRFFVSDWLLAYLEYYIVLWTWLILSKVNKERAEKWIRYYFSRILSRFVSRNRRRTLLLFLVELLHEHLDQTFFLYR